MRAAAALGLVLLMSCASGVKVTRWVGPPKYDSGPAGPLFVEVTGTESAVPLLKPALENALSKNLAFEVVPDRAPGVPVLQCQVERWHETQQQGGSATTTENLKAAFNLTRADGQVVQTGYAASQTDVPRERGGPNDSLAAANVRSVLQQLLRDFAPTTATQTLEWDEDPSAAAGLALARRGDRAGAEAAWKRESTAAAHYNLGLLLESNGDPAGALAEYATAAGVSADPRYKNALEAMKKSAAFAQRR